MSDKKKDQLGMNPSTARARLVRSIMWKLIEDTGQSTCCRCGKSMDLASYSIEHIVPWLDSDNPVDLYFNLGNISFSHRSCNVAEARQPRKRYSCKEEARQAALKQSRERRRRNYSKEDRAKRYKETGY